MPSRSETMRTRPADAGRCTHPRKTLVTETTSHALGIDEVRTFWMCESCGAEVTS